MSNPLRKPLITINEAMDELARGISKEVFKVFRDNAKLSNAKYGRALSARFLAAFITHAVCEVLNERPPEIKAPKELERHVRENFAMLKSSYEDAIAAGFQAAMTQFSGHENDYYCQIRLMPEATSKSVC